MNELRLCVLLVVVTSSYVTLAIFDPESAKGLWSAYAAVTFILSVFSWWCDHHKSRRRVWKKNGE